MIHATCERKRICNQRIPICFKQEFKNQKCKKRETQSSTHKARRCLVSISNLRNFHILSKTLQHKLEIGRIYLIFLKRKIKKVKCFAALVVKGKNKRRTQQNFKELAVKTGNMQFELVKFYLFSLSPESGLLSHLKCFLG